MTVITIVKNIDEVQPMKIVKFYEKRKIPKKIK